MTGKINNITLVGMEVEKPSGPSGRELPPREYHSPKGNLEKTLDLRELIKKWNARLDKLEEKVERMEKLISKRNEKI